MADVPIRQKLKSLGMGKRLCSTPSYVVASHVTGLPVVSARTQLGGQVKRAAREESGHIWFISAARTTSDVCSFRNLWRPNWVWRSD